MDKGVNPINKTDALQSSILKYLLSVITICFFSFHFTFATVNTDSLKLVLKSARHDTARCAILCILAETAPDDEWPKYNALLKSIAYKNLIGRPPRNLESVYIRYLSVALINEGVILSEESGDNDGAFKKYVLALKLGRHVNDQRVEATALNNMGCIYERKGKLDSAVYYYEAGLKLSRISGDKEGIANSLNNIGSVYDNKGDATTALNYYYQALDLAVKNHDPLEEALALGKIGSIHDEQGEYELALKNLSEAMSLWEKQGRLKDVANALNAIGVIYKKMGRSADAYQYHLKSLELNRRIGNVYGQGESLLGLGNSLYARGKASDALDTLSKALVFFEKAEELSMQIQTLDHIARIHLQEGNCIKAELFAELALSRIITDQDFAAQSHLAGTLYKIYKCRGNYKRALEMNEWFISASERVTNETTRKKNLHDQYKYQYERKAYSDSLQSVAEKQIYEAKWKQERSNTYVLMLSLALLILLGVVFFQRVRHRQKQKVLQLRNEMASDLHDDVGAALSSIKLLAGMTTSNPEKAIASGLVAKMEQTSKETIEAMNDIVWSIHSKNDSFPFIIERMRQFGAKICESADIRFEFHTEVSPETIRLDEMQRKNIYLIFKEAVNNAVKYAKGKAVTVKIYKYRRYLHMSIKDDGQGFNAATNGKSGNGLNNMQRRANELGGSLKIASDHSGTTVHLEFKTT